MVPMTMPPVVTSRTRGNRCQPPAQRKRYQWAWAESPLNLTQRTRTARASTEAGGAGIHADAELEPGRQPGRELRTALARQGATRTFPCPTMACMGTLAGV
jgi:hypothetical protein